MKNIQIQIDEQVLTVPEGATIMEAAESANIYIPHLCHHPDLPDIGACGLCVVEIEGEDQIKTSCTTQALDGMVIHTKTEKCKAVRRLNMELMLSNHVDDCTTCPKYSNCELQSLYQYLGVTVGRLKQTLNAVPVNKSNPLIVRDLNRCVSCGRCVRICRDVRGVGALDYERTESGRIQVDVKNSGMLVDADCRYCGACVEVCPTGALQDQEGAFRKDLNRELALIPCKAHCPAHTDVPRYVRYTKEGRYQDAIAVVREKITFPHSLGHVCMAFCEEPCRRNDLNESISIRSLKKFIAGKDQKEWHKKEVIKPDTGKKVAIVGSGPAGMTAAYDLRKSGHQVTVFEKLPVTGGMLSTGIPDYRLPRDIVQQEIDEITRIGIEMKTNVTIESIRELKDQGYDAVLLAMGTGQGSRLPIPGNDGKNVYENLDFLRRASLQDPLPVGEKVFVVGGGNVAFDCARVAKRLGGKQVTIACLEDRERMPASEEEIREGLEEEIQILNSRTFQSIAIEDGAAVGIHCRTVRSFQFDEYGKLVLELEPDSEEFIEADTIIFATGQQVEFPDTLEVPQKRGRLIQTVDGLRVNDDFVYAAGDAAYGTKSVVEAVQSGHDAAAAIDIDLGGDGQFFDQLSPIETPDPKIGIIEGFAELGKSETFNSEECAHQESMRCLQCDLRTQITRPRMWTSY